jgi:hypothetical protein
MEPLPDSKKPKPKDEERRASCHWVSDFTQLGSPPGVLVKKTGSSSENPAFGREMAAALRTLFRAWCELI